MSRKHRDKGRIQGVWTPSRHEVLDLPAWKAMSFGARALYIALLRNLSREYQNNGKVFLSTRDAAEQLGTRQMNIGEWYRELEHYGFIVMTCAGHLGVEGKGKAASWRLTDWGLGKGCNPTKEYLKWDGTLFDRKISRSTPRFRVKHTPLHTSEAHAASGPPKSEAHAASYRPPQPEAHAASYLDKPYPHLRKAAAGEAEAQRRARVNGGLDDDKT